MTGRSNVAAEAQLIDRAIAGDREARRVLFERHREAAYRTALRITGREEDALDIVQDSFIRAFERLGEFQRESGFQTWLLRIVVNRALDALRSRKVRATASLEDDHAPPGIISNWQASENRPEKQLEQRELAQRLRQALASLSPEQRAVLALYALGEMTYGEIAAALGIPIGTVMSRLYHARRRLFELLPDLRPADSNEGGTESGIAENDAGPSVVKQIGDGPCSKPVGRDTT